MPLTITPIVPGSLSLNPISPPGSVNSTYGQSVYGVNPYGATGSQALSLAPVVAGTLTLAAIQMASVYPGSLDSFSTSHVDNANEIIHASTVNDLADAVNKIERALGINPVLGASVPAVVSAGAKLYAATNLV